MPSMWLVLALRWERPPSPSVSPQVRPSRAADRYWCSHSKWVSSSSPSACCVPKRGWTPRSCAMARSTQPIGARSPTPQDDWLRPPSGSTTTRTSPSWRSARRPGASRAVWAISGSLWSTTSSSCPVVPRPRTVRSRCPKFPAGSRSSPASSSVPSLRCHSSPGSSRCGPISVRCWPIFVSPAPSNRTPTSSCSFTATTSTTLTRPIAAPPRSS